MSDASQLNLKEEGVCDPGIESKVIERFSWFVQDIILDYLFEDGFETLYKKEHYFQLFPIIYAMRRSRGESIDV